MADEKNMHQEAQPEQPEANAAAGEGSEGEPVSATGEAGGPGEEPTAGGAGPTGQDAPAAEGSGGETAPTEHSAELEQAKADLEETQDKILRLQAEFENYKKRIHKEQSEAARYVHQPLLRDLAAVMDNLERAVDHAKGDTGQDMAAFLSGIEMVIRQMTETFGKFGMQRVTSVGEPFDPTRQEAVNVVETADVPENHVVEEFQVGYLLHDRVVRPAMVVVAKRGNGGAAADGTNENPSNQNQRR